MTPNPIITLTTDFGTEDPYVGVMKGIVLGINPQAQLVDLTHSVRPQQVLQGSFLLGTAFRYFPPGTINVAVVTPKPT
jgi:S-adenosylmethionine hydrolase